MNGALLGGEPVQPQVVEDEQVWRQERQEGTVHRVVDPGLSHGLEEVVGVAKTYDMFGTKWSAVRLFPTVAGAWELSNPFPAGVRTVRPTR